MKKKNFISFDKEVLSISFKFMLLLLIDFSNKVTYFHKYPLFFCSFIYVFGIKDLLKGKFSQQKVESET